MKELEVTENKENIETIASLIASFIIMSLVLLIVSVWN